MAHLGFDFWTRTFGSVWYLYEGYFAVPWCKFSASGNKNRMTRNCKRGHGKQQPGVSFDFLFCCSFLTKKLVGVPFVCISLLASFVFHSKFVLLVKCFGLTFRQPYGMTFWPIILVCHLIYYVVLVLANQNGLPFDDKF